MTGASRARRLLAPTAVALLVIAIARVAIDVPFGVLAQGAIIGGLSALLALGLAIVWRANRVINFAAGDLGAVPATLAVLLTVSTAGFGWWAGLGVGLVAALVLGVLVEVVIVRRFARSPRLVLTVATIGLAQLLAAGALLLPRAFTLPGNPVPQPFDASITIDPITFGATDIVAVIVIPLVFVGLALFFSRADVGIAVRAAAERADRAATLGIPVHRLHRVVWVLATVLAFLAVYLRAGIIGLPIGEILGPAILLRALAAAVIGGMERLPVIAGAAILLGVVEQAVIWHWHEPGYVDPVLFVVVVVALLVTRVRTDRSADVSTWQAAREVRPVPRALARLPEVRIARWSIVAVVIVVLVGAPAFLSPSRTNLAATILVFAIIGLSLVVLTGWAGQVSLGQIAFVGVGAAVAGAATSRLGFDLVPAVVLGGLAGAAIALLIGLPALRRRGLTLAVTSLAFALATSSWLLNRSFFGEGATLDWLPSERIARPDLFGLDLTSETSFYYVCLGGLLLAYLVVVGLRRTRTGRTLIAIRENERATEAFGVRSHHTTLFAFACSGFLAAFAGALFVHQQSGLTLGPYHPEESLAVFTMAVIGGLGSIPGALLGAVYVRGVDYYFAQEWQILATGVGLLVVLMLLPGGIGGGLADLRDMLLRRVARRRGLDVASLATDDAPRAAPTTPVVSRPTDRDGSAPASSGLDGRSRTRRRSRRRPMEQASSGLDGRSRTRRRSRRRPMEPALEVRGLVVAYDGTPVLQGIDLVVDEGEVVALLGTNGAGKSTVLRAIAGLAPARAGHVLLGGTDVTGARPDALADLGVASAPGDAGTFPGLTVREHLRLAAWGRRRATSGDGDDADRALEHFPELRERLGARAGDLSGGQQQMLNLSMALVARPRLLLLDELSLGLAPVVVERLLTVVRELAEGGTTMLLVEQSVPLALEVAERAYFLEQGQVRFSGPTRDLLERPDLVRAVFLDPTVAPTTASRHDGADDSESSLPARANGEATRLEVRDVSKRFGGIVALDRVSFDVRDGEILGVLGPNGAGKSTLFDVISGFVRPETGTVVLDANGSAPDLTRQPPALRAQAGLGRSFQDARLFPALTVGEALAVACEDTVDVRDPVAAALHLPTVSHSEHQIAVRVDELLERFGLADRRDAFVRELSTGMRRILDLACVVAGRPRVLLLDEPTAGMARTEADALAPLLRTIRDDFGTTMIVIAHDLTLLHAVADRVIVLDVGAVIADGAPDVVVHDPRVVAAYIGRAP